MTMNGITSLGLTVFCGVVLACAACDSNPAATTAKDASGDALSADGPVGSCVPSVVVKATDLTGVAVPHVIADFAYAGGTTDTIGWGYNGSEFSGYNYWYPAAPILMSDLTASDWHVTGMVGDYSGVALGFACTNDSSMFTGISFTIKGKAGPSNQMTFLVGTSADNVNKVEGAASFGRCVPAVSEYDGTCLSPKIVVPVAATATTVKVKWADLIGGKPSISVNPQELSGMTWTFDWAGSGIPYAVDITIDDVVFTID